MWNVNATVAQDIVAFMGERKGRLFEYPTLPKAAVLTEGYQVRDKNKATPKFDDGVY